MQASDKNCVTQVDVFRANKLVDQLHKALEQAQQAGNQGSAELVASLQAELERQAGIIGELRAQLRASSDAQEELRRQAVSLVEAQAHMAAEQRNVVEGPPIVVAMLHAQLLEKVHSRSTCLKNMSCSSFCISTCSIFLQFKETSCTICRALLLSAYHALCIAFEADCLCSVTCVRCCFF